MQQWLAEAGLAAAAQRPWLLAVEECRAEECRAEECRAEECRAISAAMLRFRALWVVG